jgi:ParB-like chromosome segregation protein Spo0J
MANCEVNGTIATHTNERQTDGARPPYQLMPPLSDKDYRDLKESIRRHGVYADVEKDEHGNVLDGHHRVRAWEELRAEGVRLPDYPVKIRPGLSESEKRAFVRTVNVERRHLTREQKRQLIADQLRETPERSNRQVAEELGVDHKTVAVVRDTIEATGEIPSWNARPERMGGRVRRSSSRIARRRRG